MEFTNRQLEELANNVQPLYGERKITGFRLGEKAIYAIGKTYPKIKEELKIFTEAVFILYKDAGAEAHDLGDGSTSFEIKDPEKAKEVFEQREKLYDVKVNVDIHTFDLSQLFIEENQFTPAFVNSIDVFINKN